MKKWLSFPFLFVLVGFSFLSSCAGKKLSSVPSWNELTDALSDDLKTRFQVKSEASGSPTLPVQTPLVAQKKKKKKQKGNQENLEGAGKESLQKRSEVSSFEYPLRRSFSTGQSPFEVGEKLTYSISYLGISGGEFTLEILPYQWVQNRKTYHILGHAVSSSVFSLFYRLDDFVETNMDYFGLFSHRFHILLNESKQIRDALELNDSERKQTFYWNRWRRPVDSPPQESKVEAEIQAFSQDSLSALYYARTLDWGEVGSEREFPVISEGSYWTAVGSFVRRETLKVHTLGKVPTLVIIPRMKYSGILKGNGDSFLWLTDDVNRIPVRFEARVKIGTIVAELKEVRLGVK